MVDFCCDGLWDGTESLKMRLTYWYILESFRLTGHVPTLEELEKELLLGRFQIQSILDALSNKEVIRLDSGSRRILVVYPYSSIPTRHRVRFANGTEIFSMCAVDAFYVPFLADCDITIQSHCFFCRSDIEIAIERMRVSRATPTGLMIWNSAAPYTCPSTNFFCLEEHLFRWREGNPGEPGQVFTDTDSLERGEKAVAGIKQSIKGLNKILWAKADEIVCFCREVPKAAIVAAINGGVSSLEGITKETTACTGNWCENKNPNKRCCRIEIMALIEAYSE